MRELGAWLPSNNCVFLFKNYEPLVDVLSERHRVETTIDVHTPETDFGAACSTADRLTRADDRFRHLGRHYSQDSLPEWG